MIDTLTGKPMDSEHWTETAEKNVRHAAKLVLRLLRAQGCDDPEGYLCKAMLIEIAEQAEQSRGLVYRMAPANDTHRPNMIAPLFGDDGD
jgi:hypothetical protein